MYCIFAKCIFQIGIFPKCIFQSLQIPYSGSDLARGADTWGPFAVRAEDERGVDQEEQPWRGGRLQQLQPGEPRLAIKIRLIYLQKFQFLFSKFIMK